MKDKITTFLFLGFIVTFSLLHIIIKDSSISISERRQLSKFPQFEINSDYITKVDKYLLDHFPWRDTFRSIKARFNYNILKKYDNNGIYLSNNYIYKSNYPTNKESIDKFMNNIQTTQNIFENSNFYIMIIPDKNYYLKDKNFLQIDYNYLYDKIDTLNIDKIDIRNIMELSDYYETDTHWRQERLDKVVFEMSKVLSFDYKKENYVENKYDGFYGVYYGESAINRKPEQLIYLTNSVIDSAKVSYLENKELNKVYNLEELKGLDAYQVYLDGSSSFIEIYNDMSSSNKELIIFRDSFASSLTPLLINYYSKITIIDNRYISSNNFINLIKTKNQDVLFMYSTLLVNNSSSLKG